MSLKPKQEIAALRVASGEKLKDIAKDLDISAATMSNWQKDPHFVAAVNANRKELLKYSSDRLASLAAIAMDSLEDLVKSDDHKVRFQAIKLIMEANGLIGDSDQALMRYGAWIGPTSPEGVMKELQNKAWFDK